MPLSRLTEQPEAIRTYTLSFIQARNGAGAASRDIDGYVLSKVYPGQDTRGLLSDEAAQEFLKGIRNALKRDGQIFYDDKKRVWKEKEMKKPVSKNGTFWKRDNRRVGRNLTEKERNYFHRLGFDPAGWRKIDSRDQIIDWFCAHYTPDQFEHFCIAVLKEHCGVDVRITEKRPGSGADDGFDGTGEIIMENGIVHPVVVQAKKYRPGNQVGYNHLDNLCGAMTRKNIRHGFMITTSVFSKNAREYLKDYESHGYQFELIDGDTLMDIMLRTFSKPHGFGLHETADLKWLYMNEAMLTAAGNAQTG